MLARVSSVEAARGEWVPRREVGGLLVMDSDC